MPAPGLKILQERTLVDPCSCVNRHTLEVGAPPPIRQEVEIHIDEAISSLEERPISNRVDNHIGCKPLTAHSWIDTNTNSVTHTAESICVLP